MSLCLCSQVSESGKALLDVLQRVPASEAEDSASKPDFTAATHSIMGVLHQVMQVGLCDSLAVLLRTQDKLNMLNVCLSFCRDTMRLRERGSTVSSASTSVCSSVSSRRTSDRYYKSGTRSRPAGPNKNVRIYQ